MIRKRKHSVRKQRSHRKERWIERFLTSRVLVVLGILFLTIGIYFSFHSTGSSGGSLSTLLMSLLKPSEDATTFDTPGSGAFKLFLYFLPALVVLVLTARYAAKYSPITYPIALVGGLCLIVIQSKILIVNFIYGGCYYYNFPVASLYLWFPAGLLFVNALTHRRSEIILLASVYFYFSSILYASNFSGRFEYLFPYILLYGGAVAWVSRKTAHSYLNLVNFFMAAGFLGIFWLRKFVVNAKPDFLLLFFVCGTLLYLLFYAIALYSANAEERPMPRWMQLVIVWINLAVYAITTSYVMLAYYAFGYLWALALFLLTTSLAAIWLMRKLNLSAWELPHHFAVIALAATILPLVLHQQMIMLFSALLSVGMLLYASRYNNKPAFAISLLATAVMVADFIFVWIEKYLPLLLNDAIVADKIPLSHGVISGIVIVTALFCTQWILSNEELAVLKKWFKKTPYSRLIRAQELISLFLTMGWIGFALTGQLTGSLIHKNVGWFISGAAFFIFLLNYYSGKQTYFKVPILILAFAFGCSYPLLVYGSMIEIRESILFSNNLNHTSFLLHYLALAAFLILGYMASWRLYRRNERIILLNMGIQLIIIGYSFFILCTEYDNLSLYIFHFFSTSNGHNAAASNLLTANKYLPYSALIWLLTMAIFGLSFYRSNRFLKNISMFMLFGFLFKLFAFDFVTLTQGVRSAVLITLGLFLLSFAMIYPFLLRMEVKWRNERRSLKFITIPREE